MRLLPSPIQEYLHRLYKQSECREHQLLYLFCEITKQCNCACRHCGSDCSSKSDFHALTTASWVSIFEDIANSFTPAPAIVLTGGEPVLHTDFRLVIETLNRLHFKWGIVSNGYSLDERCIDLLLLNGLYSITISLDGTEHNHNWLRGKPDSYKKALQSIRLLSKQDIPYKDVVTCVHPGNIGELDDIARVLIDNGANNWRLFRIFPAGRAKGNRELLLSVAETRKMLDWIASRKAALRKTGLDVNLSCEGWLPFSSDTKVRDQPFFCRAGINIASILCDGTLTGCSNNSPLFFEGNILRDNLAYTWENRFQKFRTRPWLKDSDCAKCDSLKNCQGSSIHLWREHLKYPEFCYKECYKEPVLK
jgi:radical SAM protein with 4Fe4S-binding SPASM domain